MAWFNRRIKRVGPGRYRINLPEEEREVLAALLPQLRILLTTDDPSLNRLFPTAYADDPERDAGYQVLVRDELIQRRLATVTQLEESIAGGDVDEATMSSWMRGLNDLRLVLGTRLDVCEEDQPGDVPDDDPDAPAWMLYHYLGSLLGMVVEALARDLPAGDDQPDGSPAG